MKKFCFFSLVLIGAIASFMPLQVKANTPTQLRLTPKKNGFVFSVQPAIRWITRRETGNSYWLGSVTGAYGILENFNLNVAYGQGETISPFRDFIGGSLRYTFHISYSLSIKSRFDIYLGAHKGGFGDAIDAGFILANRIGKFGIMIGVHSQSPIGDSQLTGVTFNGLIGVDVPFPVIGGDWLHLFITASPSINNDAINTISGGIKFEI
ncbi:MAG: hypothetical protein SFU91_09880 [Chloroherpetonaceae bacterium]|nr:hypothetical protein [Chloroherpetonaceae bacterium]